MLVSGRVDFFHLEMMHPRCFFLWKTWWKIGKIDSHWYLINLFYCLLTKCPRKRLLFSSKIKLAFSTVSGWIGILLPSVKIPGLGESKTTRSWFTQVSLIRFENLGQGSLVCDTCHYWCPCVWPLDFDNLSRTPQPAAMCRMKWLPVAEAEPSKGVSSMGKDEHQGQRNLQWNMDSGVKIYREMEKQVEGWQIDVDIRNISVAWICVFASHQQIWWKFSAPSHVGYQNPTF